MNDSSINGGVQKSSDKAKASQAALLIGIFSLTAVIIIIIVIVIMNTGTLTNDGDSQSSASTESITSQAVIPADEGENANTPKEFTTPDGVVRFTYPAGFSIEVSDTSKQEALIRTYLVKIANTSGEYLVIGSDLSLGPEPNNPDSWICGSTTSEGAGTRAGELFYRVNKSDDNCPPAGVDYDYYYGFFEIVPQNSFDAELIDNATVRYYAVGKSTSEETETQFDEIIGSIVVSQSQ